MSVVERAIDKLRRTESDRSAATSQPTRREAIGSLESESVCALGQRIAVNRKALRDAGYMPEEQEDRRFAEEYRQIKRPLLTRAFSADAATLSPSPRLVMMASALPGDGKTFTSINLALSLAREKDSSVVLVDADVAKPHISRIFGVEAERGLLDALAEQDLDVNALILPTDVKGLSILPAGRVRDGATELLSSGRTSQIAAQLLARHPGCIALFDSSPLMVSSESHALAIAMGQIVLVVRAGHTPRNAVLEALEALGVDRSVSLVLNQGRRSIGERLYAYGSYGDYGDKDDPS
jgi:exopolysaccharide/PEP-CTERM locus tyrosine autokinase